MKLFAYLFLMTVLAPRISQAAGWADLTKESAVPTLLAITAGSKPPQTLPFLVSRKAEAGLWVAFADPNTIAKIGETLTKTDSAVWNETGFHLHLRMPGGRWISCPLSEGGVGSTGVISHGGETFGLHPSLWKNLQTSRPAKPAVVDAGSGFKTGSFDAKLADRDGPARSPNDLAKNPFIKYKGDLSAESASVVVPPDYDGSKPFGLMVFITPSMNGGNSLSAAYKSELASRNYIWIGPHQAGNNQPGDRRVWMAQQCRAWALHHYRIDPKRMIIAGFSNGADSASATLISTPMGFSSILLMAQPCQPPVGPVIVPQESNHQQMTIEPSPRSGLSFIRKNVRAVYYCGVKDGFITNCRNNAKTLEKELALGCKLFEIQDLGHGTPPGIADGLDFLDSPRNTKSSTTKSTSAGDAESALAPLRPLLTADPVRARLMFTQLWENHPDLREDPALLDVLAKLEALP